MSTVQPYELDELGQLANRQDALDVLHLTSVMFGMYLKDNEVLDMLTGSGAAHQANEMAAIAAHAISCPYKDASDASQKHDVERRRMMETAERVIATAEKLADEMLAKKSEGQTTKLPPNIERIILDALKGESKE